ncbi:MAG: methyltransferase [Clostridia bacterium]|nr:methyltransferase [Clostridia bacterium]
MLVLEELGLLGLKIYQDDELYRFTSDAVVLTKFASNKKGDVVADFCSGSGIVGMHYYALNPKVKSVDLIEIQPELARLSEKSVELNNLQEKFTIINKPIQELPSEYNNKYSLILCNPPYKKAGSGEVNLNDKIAMCRHEVTVTQKEIISIAYKKLKHGGRLCMCQKIERFLELISDMQSANLTPSRIQMVTGKTGGEPYLVMVEGVKGVKPQLKVLANYVNGV